MGIFSQSGSSDCPARPSTAGGEAQPIAGSLTFHQIIIIIGWVCIALTTCLWLGLLLPHLRQYARPNEQRQALRIILTPVVFAIASILSMHFYHAAQYIAPIASLYEAYALASLFLLYVHYVTPESSSREEYFQGLDRLARSGKIKSGGSLRWFRVSYNIQMPQSCGRTHPNTKDRKSGRPSFSTACSTPLSLSSKRSWKLLGPTVTALQSQNLDTSGYETHLDVFQRSS